MLQYLCQVCMNFQDKVRKIWFEDEKTDRTPEDVALEFNLKHYIRMMDNNEGTWESRTSLLIYMQQLFGVRISTEIEKEK